MKFSFFSSLNKTLNKSLNKLAREQQKKLVIYLMVGVFVLILLGGVFIPTKKVPKNNSKKLPAMTGITKSDFTEEASKSALESEESKIEHLTKKLATMNNNLSALQKALTMNAQNKKKIIEKLENKISDLENVARSNVKNKRLNAEKNSLRVEAKAAGYGITSTGFTYTEQKTKGKTPANYVPPGTFARAVLLSGADTNAGVNGQTDTLPITLRLLDNGTLPNHEHSSLKGCFVTAAAYGDASSERGQIRLQRLSCVRGNGQILDIAVEGTVSDMGGSDGIRGQVVMRNGRLLWNAGFSGFFSGVGSAMQQSLTTQSISPLGTTNNVPPGKVFQYGAYGGANTALGKLANYYIKLADLYHPIVQIHAGSRVDVVFLKGFSLDLNQPVTKPPPKVQTETHNFFPEKIMQSIKDIKEMPQEFKQSIKENIKNSKLGQTISGGKL